MSHSPSCPGVCCEVTCLNGLRAEGDLTGSNPLPLQPPTTHLCQELNTCRGTSYDGQSLQLRTVQSRYGQKLFVRSNSFSSPVTVFVHCIRFPQHSLGQLRREKLPVRCCGRSPGLSRPALMLVTVMERLRRQLRAMEIRRI